MAAKYQDLWLWTSLGVFGFCAAWAVHTQLHAMRTASETDQNHSQQDFGPESHENTQLKLSSLEQLAQSPNSDIRAASVNIITELAVQNFPYNLMLRGIVSPDPERRNRALTCLNFLSASPSKLPPRLRDTYEALIDCLCNLLEEAPATEKSLVETNHASRTQHSYDALTILGRLLRYDMEGATQAGLVTKWLKRYPFGNFRAKENKMKSINRLLGKDYNDPLMHIIMLAALSSGECHRQLIQCGLTDIPENSLEDNDEMKWSFHNGPIPPNVSPSRQNGRRRREESQEERALRRRRREAMVLGENGRPIARDDIIEQNATAPSEEFQPELN